jgi:hypothetical protein
MKTKAEFIIIWSLLFTTTLVLAGNMFFRNFNAQNQNPWNEE